MHLLCVLTLKHEKFCDERYAENEMVYGYKPNRFFEEQLDDLSTGNILLPAEGEGRNSVYAATTDWQATAFDFSAVAQQKALQWAAKNNVSLNYAVSDLLQYNAEPNSFDVIALIYVHMKTEVRSAFHQKAITWLKPGGKLILEAFNLNQINNQSGGPKEQDMLYSRSMLKAHFAECMKIDYCGNVTLMLDEGAFHSGKADVVRLIATKM